jgi:glycosyltransferase involved in cell wall biosynthesis
MKIAIVVSHPIQYLSPLLRELAKHISLRVYYYSGKDIAQMDKGFGQEVSWDIPLLEGYESTFLKNSSSAKSMSNRLGDAVNFEIFKVLRNSDSQVIILNGWAYMSDWFILISAKLFGHKVWMRAEMPWNQEKLKPNSVKRRIKYWLFKYILFKYLVDRFLYIGSQNKLFYLNHGVPDRKLIFAPYAVENERFLAQKSADKFSYRQKYGIPSESIIILYSGKLIDKKRPLDLLRAFNLLDQKNVVLFYLGDGPLRGQIDTEIQNKKIQNVIISGFINQSEIGKIYNMADVFVMCSGIGETWGLSVNEAMNFGLPIIVSGTCGSAYDLVVNGQNGFIFKEGDIGELKMHLENLCKDEALRVEFGKKSSEKIMEHSHHVTVQNILEAMASI